MNKILKSSIVLALLMPVTCLAQAANTQQTATPPSGYVVVTPKTPLNETFLLTVEKQKNIGITFQYQKLQLEDAVQKQLTDLQNKAQDNSNKLIPYLNSEITRIKQENGWGDDVNFDVASESFIKKTATQPNTPAKSNMQPKPATVTPKVPVVAPKKK